MPVQLRQLLRTGRSRALIAAVALAVFALFALFDHRWGGTDTRLWTTELRPPGYYVEAFGALWYFGGMALNAVAALLTGILVALVVANVRASRGGVGAACSTGGSMAVALSTFGCPGCVLPIAGTLGLTAFANTLPLMGVEFKFGTVALLAGTLAWVVRGGRRLAA